MTFTNGNSTKFFYSAEGEKLRAVHTTGGTTTQVDYCSNIVYEAGVQKYLLHDEGYYDLAGGSYHYYLKDHLGNNRVVISQNGSVEQTTHYYPYSGTFASTTTGQPYKYNGKEYNTHNGLNWYDYGARHYDPAIARWTTQDPLAERYYCESQYHFSGNNPIKNVDTDGKDYNVYFFTDEQKILIHAIYYTSKGGEKSAREAVAFYNNGNDWQYEYKGKTYEVLFNLEVKSISSPRETVESLENESNVNSYVIGEPKTNNPKDGFITTGSTEDKRYITILNNYQEGSLTGAHEIGHTLNLTPEDTHSQEGIMKPHEKDRERDRYITQDNINHMINSLKGKWQFRKVRK